MSSLRSIALTAATLAALLFCSPLFAQGYDAAIKVLEEERILGETNAGLLKTYAAKDVPIYAGGIQRYAAAQAGFNALIAQLEAGLISGEDVTATQDFQLELQRASNRRMELSRYVQERVIDPLPEGSKGPAAVAGGLGLIAAAPELLAALKDVALEIWDAYKQADQDRRDAMRTQLGAMKWRQFQDVPAL